MRGYSGEVFTVEGVLKLSGNLGAIIEMDGGGYWLTMLNRKTRKLLNRRIRATGTRVGFNDFAIKTVEVCKMAGVVEEIDESTFRLTPS